MLTSYTYPNHLERLFFVFDVIFSLTTNFTLNIQIIKGFVIFNIDFKIAFLVMLSDISYAIYLMAIILLDVIDTSILLKLDTVYN